MMSETTIETLAGALQPMGVQWWMIRQDLPMPLARRADGERTARLPGEVRAAAASAAAVGSVPVRGGYGYSIDSAGIARVDLVGPLMKLEDVRYYGDGTATDAVILDVAAMAADPNVRGVMFNIDSPGGTVAGAYELADAIWALSQVKPTASYGGSNMTSAAYLQAAMTGTISAGRTNFSGSIGTRTVVYDAHVLFERAGVKPIPIDSGGMKSAGLFGTEITAEQQAYFQSLIDAHQAHFVEAVARGLGISTSQAAGLADGRVFPADKAKSLGLLDHVESFDSAMARLTQMAQTKSTPSGRRAMQRTVQPAQAGPEGTRVSESNTGAAAPTQAGQTQEPPKTPATQQAGGIQAVATAVEIDRACPGASSDFKLECLRTGQNLVQVKDSFIGWQAGQIRSRDEELTKASASLTAANAKITEQSATIVSLEAKVKAAGGLVPTAAAETRATNSGEAVVDPKARAKQEWDANANGCQQQFASEAAYIGYRKSQLAGRIKESTRKSA